MSNSVCEILHITVYENSTVVVYYNGQSFPYKNRNTCLITLHKASVILYTIKIYAYKYTHSIPSIFCFLKIPFITHNRQGYLIYRLKNLDTIYVTELYEIVYGLENVHLLCVKHRIGRFLQTKFQSTISIGG